MAKKPLEKSTIGGFTVVGNFDAAIVREGQRLLEEFDNETTTDKKEPSAFKRAVAWATKQTEQTTA